MKEAPEFSLRGFFVLQETGSGMAPRRRLRGLGEVAVQQAFEGFAVTGFVRAIS